MVSESASTNNEILWKRNLPDFLNERTHARGVACVWCFKVRIVAFPSVDLVAGLSELERMHVRNPRMFTMAIIVEEIHEGLQGPAFSGSEDRHGRTLSVVGNLIVFLIGEITTTATLPPGISKSVTKTYQLHDTLPANNDFLSTFNMLPV